MPPLILTSTSETSAMPPVPRQDFALLADALNGSLLYPTRTGANTLLSRLEKRTATDIRQAFAALKRRRGVSVYVSLSEKVGIPLALLLPKNRRSRPAHVLVAHHLTSSNKRQLQERVGYLHRFDRIVVLATPQSVYLTEEARYPAERINLVFDSVDTGFWNNGSNATVEPINTPTLSTAHCSLTTSYLLTVGRERRDYETFAEALRLLPEERAVVVASSPWSREAGLPFIVRDSPGNLTIRENLSYSELRELYVGALLVVVPLQAGTDYAAGVNGCLEGMAMGKPVLATQTPGLADYVGGADNERIATAPANSVGLADAIRALRNDPTRCERLALAGHRFAQQTANIDIYVANMARIIQESLRER